MCGTIGYRGHLPSSDYVSGKQLMGQKLMEKPTGRMLILGLPECRYLSMFTYVIEVHKNIYFSPEPIKFFLQSCLRQYSQTLRLATLWWPKTSEEHCWATPRFLRATRRNKATALKTMRWQRSTSIPPPGGEAWAHSSCDTWWRLAKVCLLIFKAFYEHKLCLTLSNWIRSLHTWIVWPK